MTVKVRAEITQTELAQMLRYLSEKVEKDEAYLNVENADPTNIQQIAASQIELLPAYHNLVLDQARRSFRWALIAAGIGLGFFIASVSFLLFQQAQISTISLISGSLIEVIAAINFYLYGKTSEQLANFQARLDTTQRFLLANSVCEVLDNEFKQQSRAELVKAIAGIIPSNCGLYLEDKHNKKSPPNHAL